MAIFDLQTLGVFPSQMGSEGCEKELGLVGRGGGEAGGVRSG